MDQLNQAIYSTVKESSVGRADLARLMKIGYEVFNGKANPNRADSYFSPGQLVELQNFTGDFRITDAMKGELHTDGAEGELENKGVVESVLEVCCEQGHLVNLVHEAMADGRVTVRENEVCQRAINNVIGVLGRLKKSLSKHK